MPIVELHVIEGYSDTDKTRLCAALTQAVRIVVPAPPEAVTVLLHELPAGHYMRGARHRRPAPALPDPGDLVRDFLDAKAQRDLDRAGAMLDDDFTMQFPGAAPMRTLAALVDWARPRYQFVTKTYDGFDALQTSGDAAVVYCRGTLSGAWPDGSTFDGIRFIDRFEIVNGKLTRQDVWNDIAETRGQT